jgi:ATP-binding cassette subfamily F protein uup
MLVLDEPTNDLDVDTLELLEDLLADYDGTLLIVSHDRSFLDHLVTSTIIFEGGGRLGEYVGGYEDWLRQRRPDPPAAARKTDTSRPLPADRVQTTPATAPAKRKLSYTEKRELETLPQRIEALEEEQRRLEQETGRGEFYQQDKAAITAALARLDALSRELARAYEQWESLESRRD